MDQINGKVCVTGASGYLASWLVKRLLLAGYHVTGTVRDPGNERKLAHLWRLEGAKERLQIVRANLMDEGSFDDAINGCQGVFHTASPVLKPSSNPKACLINQLLPRKHAYYIYIYIYIYTHTHTYIYINISCAEIIEPAVNGTLNVLRSCQKNPSLRRVVLTSSSSTVRIRYDFDSKIPLDESSWSSVDLCESLQIWYALSKILAEKAAWEFCGHNGIDLVTILPSFVIGPSLPPDLCSTASDVLGLLKGEKEKFQWHGRMGYVHIDDVALCHILVYEHQNSHGRYLCSSTVVDNNELVSLLSTRYPLLPIPERFELLDRPYYEFNTSKLTSLLGFKFKSIEEMFDDCIAWFDEQGYLC
ncbi:tetraketide alpha-pyrone reductase 1 [Citrus sinensis]|uniref:Tetraketide alpha-pyrone reductase 1 n=1 Tax=Citrus sinensis TaxID=2711 RepID=A0ACB8IB06_CITSI|nr:tetraketide alpha-pyrone reductase 1 [Citrus sinensis]